MILFLFVAIFLCSLYSYIFAQDPGMPDKIRFLPWGSYVLCPPCTGKAVAPMIVVNDESLRTISIPLQWTGPLTMDTVIFHGQRSDRMTIKNIVVDNNAKTVYLFATVAPAEPPMPPGSGIMTYLYFTVQDTGAATLDTGLTEILDLFYFEDNQPQQFLPGFFSSEFHILPQNTPPGDVNLDGLPTIADVVWLINYLYRAGPPPSYLPSGDVNTDGIVSVSDVVFYINYFYKGGPNLGMGCSYSS